MTSLVRAHARSGDTAQAQWRVYIRVAAAAASGLVLLLSLDVVGTCLICLMICFTDPARVAWRVNQIS